MTTTFRLTAMAFAALMLGACGGGDDDTTPVPEEQRDHDARTFTVDATKLPFDALPEQANAKRWWGILDGAGYRVEVPENWNGKLVMFAHGYAGTGTALSVSNPSIRAHLLSQGYAWAASSYSTNYYDVRAGIEDTNNLALKFQDIAKSNGVSLAKPSKTYIVGQSMGGHIAAAAVEKETLATANHKVSYAGSVPMCGVLGDLELYNFFGAAQLAAQKLTGHDATAWPVANWSALDASVQSALFSTFPSVTTPLGDKYKAIVMNLTGGPRPMFDEGFAGSMTATVWGTFGRDGKIMGVLNKQAYDTRNVVYQLDSDPALSEEEKAFNQTILRITPDPEANRLRRDGLRWFPAVAGEVSVPVVTIHTLGDMYVPFSMEQVYKKRVDAKGNGKWVVQRAIRGISHCDFKLDEQTQAFDDMIAWEQTGKRPDGDEVLDAATVAAPDYGCKFSSASRSGCVAP